MISIYDYDDSDDKTPEKQRLYEACLKGSKAEIRQYMNNEENDTQYIKNGMTPLHVVVTSGRGDADEVIDELLKNGVDVNTKTTTGDDTALHLAVQHLEVREAFPIVLKILEYHPDLQIRNRSLRTPWDLAIARESYELAEALSGNMNAHEAKDYYKKRTGEIYGVMLVKAVLESKEDDIRESVRFGANPDYLNEYGNGAIHYAVTVCTLPPLTTLPILLDGGADVNLKDSEGDTALNLTIKSEKIKNSGKMYEIAELLVQQGALGTFKDLDGNDALASAKKRRYQDIVELLQGRRQQHVREPTPPPPDYDDFQPAAIEEMEFSPPPRPTPRQYEPPPRRSFTKEPPPDPTPPPPRPETPEEEFQHPHPSQYQHWEPLSPGQIATDLPSPEVMTESQLPPTLEESPEPEEDFFDEEDEEEEDPEAIRAKYRNPRPDGQSHLMHAILRESIKEVREILKYTEANPNERDKAGFCPIHAVILRETVSDDERHDMVEALIDAGADVNARITFGNNTPLHLAASKNRLSIVELLLSNKSNSHATNKDRKKAYDLAKEKNYTDVMFAIEEHQIKVRERMRKNAKMTTCNIL